MLGYAKLIGGVMIIMAVVIGSFSLFNGDIKKHAQAIVDNGVDTTGVVEKRVKHLVTAKKGRFVGAGFYYTMTYNFTTLEGKKYSREINVTKEQAYSVNDGDPIQVRYNKNQPSINSALGFKEYMTEEFVENLPYGTFIFTYLLMLLGGGWLCWSGWRSVQPDLGGFSVGSLGGNNGAHAVPQNRLNSVNRSGGAQTFGQR